MLFFQILFTLQTFYLLELIEIVTIFAYFMTTWYFKKHVFIFRLFQTKHAFVLRLFVYSLMKKLVEESCLFVLYFWRWLRHWVFFTLVIFIEIIKVFHQTFKVFELSFQLFEMMRNETIILRMFISCINQHHSSEVVFISFNSSWCLIHLYKSIMSVPILVVDLVI